MEENDQTFLRELLRKRSDVEKIGASTGKDVSSALREVDRQIRQALSGNNPLKGEGVTKSGEED